jgi:hypothetical protein
MFVVLENTAQAPLDQKFHALQDTTLLANKQAVLSALKEYSALLLIRTLKDAKKAITVPM